jgi:hypothetical protein
MKIVVIENENPDERQAEENTGNSAHCCRQRRQGAYQKRNGDG